MRTSAAGSQKPARTEKVVIIGAASSGKTSLVNRLIRNNFAASSEATIGAAFVTKQLQVDGQDVKLDIWDTGGTEKYRSLAPMYYRGARAAVIVYDVTSEQSFKEAGEWLAEFREKGQPSAIVVAAANKIDLADSRAVSREEGEDFAFQNQMEFTKETSALTGAGVNELFEDLTRQLLLLPALGGCEIEITEDEGPKEQKGNCC